MNIQARVRIINALFKMMGETEEFRVFCRRQVEYSGLLEPISDDETERGKQVTEDACTTKMRVLIDYLVPLLTKLLLTELNLQSSLCQLAADTDVSSTDVIAILIGEMCPDMIKRMADELPVMLGKEELEEEIADNVVRPSGELASAL